MLMMLPSDRSLRATQKTSLAWLFPILRPFAMVKKNICASDAERSTTMQSKLEKITPKKAAEYLAQNFCNRPISPPTRQKYVRLIQTGKFYVTHQGVAFDEQGRLRDGQHRLAAVVEADTPVTMMVTRGLTEAAALAIDDGRKRTDAHALSMAHGALISGFVTAIAKEMYTGGLHLDTSTKPVTADRLEIVEFYGQHEEAIRTIVEAFRDNTAGVGAAYILAALARATYHVPAKKLKRFAEVLASGYSKEGEELIITLRNHILLKRRQEKKTRALRDELYAKTEQTLVDWVENKGTGRIGKAKSELFPLPTDRVLAAEAE
jgi:hypothetical protein